LRRNPKGIAAVDGIGASKCPASAWRRVRVSNHRDPFTRGTGWPPSYQHIRVIPEESTLLSCDDD